MTPQTIESAARLAYEGSSMHLCPWLELPASRRESYVKQAERLMPGDWRARRGLRVYANLGRWSQRKERAA